MSFPPSPKFMLQPLSLEYCSMDLSLEGQTSLNSGPFLEYLIPLTSGDVVYCEVEQTSCDIPVRL